jgi:hypothetical protein
VFRFTHERARLVEIARQRCAKQARLAKLEEQRVEYLDRKLAQADAGSKTSGALDRWRRVRFSKTLKFGNEINSQPFNTVQLTVVFESVIFYVSNFNALAILRTIEWEFSTSTALRYESTTLHCQILGPVFPFENSVSQSRYSHDFGANSSSKLFILSEMKRKYSAA